MSEEKVETRAQWIERLQSENNIARRRMRILEALLSELESKIPADVERALLTPIDMRKMLSDARSLISAGRDALNIVA